MQNPLDRVKRFMAQLGKPIRPIVELQKGGSVVNIITTPVQDGNLIIDSYRQEGWERPDEVKTTAVYVDGVFKGIGYFASEMGVLLNVEVNIDAHGLNPETKKEEKITFSFKGLVGKLLDAALHEKGSALKASFVDKLVFAGIGLLLGILAGMSYAR